MGGCRRRQVRHGNEGRTLNLSAVYLPLACIVILQSPFVIAVANRVMHA